MYLSMLHLDVFATTVRKFIYNMHGKLKQQLKFFTPTQFVNLLEKHILFWHIYSQCNHVRFFAIFHISK